MAVSATNPIPRDFHANTKFERFNGFDVIYKHINNIDIYASILIPTNLKPGKYPVAVRWHGGYLISGARLLPDHLHDHNLNWVYENSSILICPDYRLLPEVNGNDILDDVADFYGWLKKDFGTAMANTGTGIEPDLDDIVIRGESAGGYLSIQSALLHPEMNFRAIIAQYPVIDAASPFFSQNFGYDKKVNGSSSPDIKVLQDYMASKPPVVVSDETLSRRGIMLAIINYGYYFEYLTRGGEDPERPQPLKIVKRAKTNELPFMWIYHGNQDTGVPVEGTQLFEATMKEIHPTAKTKFTYVDGAHGFDRNASLQDEWLAEGLKEVGKYWPKK